MSKNAIQLVDASGHPLKTEVKRVKKESTSDNRGQVIGAFSSFVSALYGLDSPSLLRAMQPFENHAWVYGATMALALNMSQAPYMLYQESEDQMELRRKEVTRSGRKWTGHPAGSLRTATKRYNAQKCRRMGIPVKGLEPSYSHPLMQVLAKPNEFMTESQLWQATVIWQVLKGSCMWLLLNNDDTPLEIGSIPDKIIPLPCDLFRPRYVGNVLRYWEFRVPLGMGYGSKGAFELLSPNEVVQFKFFSQGDLLAGWAPIASAAAGIHVDLLASESTKSILTNGSDPGGVLMTEGTVDDEEEKKMQKKWEQRHKGSSRKGRTAFLSGGVKYVSTGLSPQDMQWKDMRSWDREEVLAVIGVPKSVMCVTDDLNFSIQISQDRNFWDKRLIPIIRNIEDVIDSSILYHEADHTAGMFDLSGIEALKAGLQEQVQTMNILTGPNIHMPPKIAAQVIGLEIPEYEGNDVALINPTVRRVEDIIRDSPMTDAQRAGTNIQPLDEKQPGDEKRPASEDTEEGQSQEDPSKVRPGGQNSLDKVRQILSDHKANYWKNWISVLQLPVENKFKATWRSFLSKAKKSNLDLFDKRMKAIDPESLFITLEQMKEILGTEFKPEMLAALKKTFEFTTSTDIGTVPIFNWDDPQLLAVLEKRVQMLLEHVPKTLLSNLRETVMQGIKAGEDLTALRQRVSAVYDGAASSKKTLEVARTESAGLLNTVRDTMFKLQGIGRADWSTAGDEHVRDSHQLYGTQGPKDVGFNYLSLTGKSGQLRFPGDNEAPADEVINCRCVQIPIA